MKNTLIIMLSLMAVVFLMSGCGRAHHSDNWYHNDHGRNHREISVGDKGHGRDSEDMSISVKVPDDDNHR